MQYAHEYFILRAVYFKMMPTLYSLTNREKSIMIIIIPPKASIHVIILIRKNDFNHFVSQQLSANLSDHSDLKLDYLSEAVMALDDSDDITADHLKTLLPMIVQHLQVSFFGSGKG